MAKHHNWNQLHKILLKLGFIQIQEYNSEFLYYRNPFGEIIMIQKDNNYPIEYVHKILGKIGITYELFVTLYSSDDDRI